MAYVSKKRRFPMISAGTIKAFIFIILVGTAIGFWLYTQKIFSQVREFQNTVVKAQVQIYLSIINPELTYESGLSSELFDAAVRKAPYPFIFTDEQLNPIQYYWHNVGIAQNDTSHAAQQKLKKLVKKMDRTNPPEQVPMPALDTIIDTLTVYEMPSGRDTSIVITDENEKYLNSRNVHIDPEDTLAVQNMLHEIDSYSHPVRFRKENAVTLIF
ncbi:MAG TPA: hypothetical protein VMZ04_00075, partial [Anaerolineae bacterium]|nr:hypothetical protein [Anaerolineae bacterium]